MNTSPLKIASGAIDVVVDTNVGGRISSIKIADTELLVTKAESVIDWGLYPMVPYAGRVRDATLLFDGKHFPLRENAKPHSIHGTVFDSPWHLESHDETSICLSTKTGPNWPFAATVIHNIEVTKSFVRCEMTITAAERMPAQLGWHPWFLQPTGVTTNFNSMLRRDNDAITSLDRVEPLVAPVDDCFFEPNAWPVVHIGNYAIEIASDCPYWVRYDSPNGDVCIEPQSGPPNGINSKPLILETGQQFSRWMEMRITDQL